MEMYVIVVERGRIVRSNLVLKWELGSVALMLSYYLIVPLSLNSCMTLFDPVFTITYHIQYLKYRLGLRLPNI